MVIFQPLWILESSIYVKGVSEAGLVTALEQGKWKFKNAFSVWVEPLLRRRQRNAQFMGGKNKKLRCLWHEKKMFEIQFRMTCILIPDFRALFRRFLTATDFVVLPSIMCENHQKSPIFEFSPQNWALFSIHTSSLSDDIKTTFWMKFGYTSLLCSSPTFVGGFQILCWLR